jgi:hypothetical protein
MVSKLHHEHALFSHATPTDITAVNELSGTMDLESTLVRAESLFKRFQRTVETIDKKGNFPSAPQARQRKLAATPIAQGAGRPVDPKGSSNSFRDR